MINGLTKYTLASRLKLIRNKWLINKITHILSCLLKTVFGFGVFQSLCFKPAGTACIEQRLVLKNDDQHELTLWASVAGMVDKQYDNKSRILKENLEYWNVLNPTRNIDEMCFIASEGSAQEQVKEKNLKNIENMKHERSQLPHNSYTTEVLFVLK